jgi:hypothetical protein
MRMRLRSDFVPGIIEWMTLKFGIGYWRWKLSGQSISGQCNFFLIGIVGGGVQLGPLGTAEKLVEWLAGETEVLGENLPQCRFVHHKPHMLPGREPGPPRWEASD